MGNSKERVCSIAFSQTWFFGTVLLIWTLTVIGEIRCEFHDKIGAGICGHMSMCHLIGALKYERGSTFGKGYSIALGTFRARGGPSRARAQALKRAQEGA